ncbi:MAG: hypothetical protein ACOY3H_00670 [Bacillota bacterium]
MYFFIDESGYNGDYIFTAVCVKDPAIAKNIIKKWRDWMKKRKKGFPKMNITIRKLMMLKEEKS